MNKFYPIEVLIKNNLKTVVEGMVELKAKRDEYTKNPGIITQREAKYAREKLLMLIEEASNVIHKEWLDKYSDCVSEEEIRDLTS